MTASSIDSLVGPTGAMFAQWAGVEWEASDPAAVATAAARWAVWASQAQTIALLAAGQHEANGGIRNDGDGTAGDWHSRQTKSSKDTGRRQAARAKRLSKAKKTSKAAAEGKLSTEQAEKLAAARNEDNAELFDQVEEELIEKAQGSYDDAVKAAEDFRRQTGETATQRAERLWKRRSASCWDDDEGMTQGRQSLAGDVGALWHRAFDAFVQREFDQRERGDGRTNAQVRADAMRSFAAFALAALTGQSPRYENQATVNVGVRYEDLTRPDEDGEWYGEDLDTGQPLSGDEVRRMCCDSDIVRLVTKGDSQTVDVGRKTRGIPTGTRRAVWNRDGGCTYPGCTARHGIQVHHIIFWALFGPTDLANLACMCWRHHRLVHEGGWKVHREPDTQRTIWTAPDGRKLIGQRRATAGDQAPRRTTAA